MLVYNCFSPQHSLIDDAMNICMGGILFIIIIYFLFKLYDYVIFSRLEKKSLKKDMHLSITSSDIQEDTLILTDLFTKKH